MYARNKFVCVLASSLDGSRKLMYNNAVHIGYSNSNIEYFQVLQSKRCKVPGRVLGQTFYFPSNFTIQKCFFEAKFVKIQKYTLQFYIKSKNNILGDLTYFTKVLRSYMSLAKSQHLRYRGLEK